MATISWWRTALFLVMVAASAAAFEAHEDNDDDDGGDAGDAARRYKRQISFSFGHPNFAGGHAHGQPGRQEPGRPVNVGDVLGSVLGGFLNPQSQNAPNNFAGALAGLNNALSPNQVPGDCNQNQGGCEHGCRQQGRFVRCFCNGGFVLNRDRKTCADINECQFSNGGCRQICNNTPGSFECGCRPGFTLLGDSVTCQPGGGFSGGGFNGGGFQGGGFPGGGFPGGGGGGFPGGGGGVFPGAQHGGSAGSCSFNNGGCEQVCQQTFQGVRCFCNIGYSLQPNGRSCLDLDECSFRNGGCSNLCRNTEGSFRCGCSAGTLLQDGISCAAAAGCSVNNGGCEQTCNPSIPTIPGRTPCGCNPGYTLNSDGVTCSDVNECQTNNGNCEQVCKNQPGSFVCQCREGFTLTGTTCQAKPREEGPPVVATPSPPTPSPPSTQLRSCGQNTNKNINDNIRIVGGRPSSPTDWPWMAALLQTRNNNQFCGGVLLTAEHVLTAAHCVVQFSSSEIRVRVGEYDFQESTDNNPLDFNVADIDAHEQYDTNTQENDIAILRLDRSVQFSNFVQPVCLPPPGTDAEGLSAFVIGWGTTAFGGPVSNVLREVQVPIWTKNDCDASYPGKVFTKMMCAGLKKGGKDSCQGDSGGPLLTQLPGSRTWYVVGVVSWGIECARADRPGVYTIVTQYLSWIDSKLQ